MELYDQYLEWPWHWLKPVPNCLALSPLLSSIGSHLGLAMRHRLWKLGFIFFIIASLPTKLIRPNHHSHTKMPAPSIGGKKTNKQQITFLSHLREARPKDASDQSIISTKLELKPSQSLSLIFSTTEGECLTNSFTQAIHSLSGHQVTGTFIWFYWR